MHQSRYSSTVKIYRLEDSDGRRKLSRKRAALPAAKGNAVAESAQKSRYPATAKRPAKRGSGVVRRKNLNIDQGLLDQARRVLGVRTETEAVELGLGAVIELVEFHRDMLDGFDRLMESGGFTHDQSEERDFSGFVTASRTR